MNIFEREATQVGYKLSKDYITIEHGLLKGIKLIQTTLAPEDAIYVHPFMLGKILSNIDTINEVVNIHKNSSERE